MIKHILVVDDSIIARKVLVKAISVSTVASATIHQANNGKEGLEILEKHDIDVVFLDINMPVMNGMEFMQHLRAREDKKRDTKVIVISTEGSKERIQELYDKDIMAYLRKPVTPEQMNDLVGTLTMELTFDA